jgi:uncharacterized SAM-binding protein YcdF (DUF218 family)
MNRSGYFKLLLALLLAASGVLFSSKAGGYWLSAGLERTVTPVAAPATITAQAIVVLTGGQWRNSEAVRLQRATGLPVLASGGGGEAAAIKRELEREFGVPVRWTEGESHSTEENALFSAKILASAGIQKILLVTHALHMPRAQRLFSGTGLEVVAAPTDFSSAVALRWTDFWPSAEGQKSSQSALHEIVGLAWYRLRQGLVFAKLLAGPNVHFSAQSGE